MGNTIDKYGAAVRAIELFCLEEAERRKETGKELIPSFIETISTLNATLLHGLYQSLLNAGVEFEPQAFLDAYHEKLKRNYELAYGKLK